MAAAATRDRHKAVELTALRAKGAGQAQFPAPTRRLFVKTITAWTAKRLGQVLARTFVRCSVLHTMKPPTGSVRSLAVSLSASEEAMRFITTWSTHFSSRWPD